MVCTRLWPWVQIEKQHRFKSFWDIDNWTVQAPQLGIIHFRFCLWHRSKPTFSLNLGCIIDYIQVWRWEISIYWLTIHHVNKGKMEVYWCKTHFSKAIWVPIWELYLNRFSKPSWLGGFWGFILPNLLGGSQNAMMTIPINQSFERFIHHESTINLYSMSG